MAPTTLGSLYALATALTWAVAVVLFKRLGETLSPVSLNLFKNLVGLVALLLTLPLVDASGSRAFDSDAWVLLLSGVVGVGLADVWLFAGLNRLGASLQAVVDGLYAPMVMFWAYFWLGEAPTGLDLLGGLLVLAALLLIAWPGGTLVPESRRATFWAGLAYAVAAMVVMTFAIVWIQPVLARQDIVHATMLRMLGGVLALLAYLPFDGRERRRALRALRPDASWRVSVPASLLGTYVAVMLWLLGFKYAPANVAAILNQTSVFFLALIAALFLGERLTARGLVAVSLGFAGSALVLVR